MSRLIVSHCVQKYKQIMMKYQILNREGRFKNNIIIVVVRMLGWSDWAVPDRRIGHCSSRLFDHSWPMFVVCAGVGGEAVDKFLMGMNFSHKRKEFTNKKRLPRTSAPFHTRCKPPSDRPTPLESPTECARRRRHRTRPCTRRGWSTAQTNQSIILAWCGKCTHAVMDELCLFWWSINLIRKL